MDKLPEREREDIHQEALRQARVEVEGEVRQEIVDIFGELLERMGERLIALIGETATAAIFGSAKREATRDYPFLGGMAVNETGIRLDRLGEDVAAFDRATIRAGLLAFTDSIIGIITALTGDILVRKVAPLVQEFKAKLEEE